MRPLDDKWYRHHFHEHACNINKRQTTIVTTLRNNEKELIVTVKRGQE